MEISEYIWDLYNKYSIESTERDEGLDMGE